MNSGATPPRVAAVPHWVPCAPCPDDGGLVGIDGLVNALLAQHSELLGIINRQSALLQRISEQQGYAMHDAVAALSAAVVAAPEAALELGFAVPEVELSPAAQQQCGPGGLDPAWEVREPSQSEATDLLDSAIYWDF